MVVVNGVHTQSRTTLEDLCLTSLLTMSSRSGMLTSAFTKGILSTSSGKGLCLTLYLIPTALLGVGRPSGTNTCCVQRGENRQGRAVSDTEAGLPKEKHSMPSEICLIWQCDLTLWLARAPRGWWMSCMVQAWRPAVPLIKTVTDGLGSVTLDTRTYIKT